MLSLRDSSSLAFCSRFWGEVYIVRLTYAAGDGAEAMTQTGAFQPSSLIRPMIGIGRMSGMQVKAMVKKRGELWIRR